MGLDDLLTRIGDQRASLEANLDSFAKVLEDEIGRVKPQVLNTLFRWLVTIVLSLFFAESCHFLTALHNFQ